MTPSLPPGWPVTRPVMRVDPPNLMSWRAAAAVLCVDAWACDVASAAGAARARATTIRRRLLTAAKVHGHLPSGRACYLSGRIGPGVCPKIVLALSLLASCLHGRGTNRWKDQDANWHSEVVQRREGLRVHHSRR